MGDHDTPHTCLSSDPHDKAVRDPLLHYFGCLKESDREDYLNSLRVDAQRRLKWQIKAEQFRIKSLRSKLDVFEPVASIIKEMTAAYESYKASSFTTQSSVEERKEVGNSSYVLHEQPPSKGPTRPPFIGAKQDFASEEPDERRASGYGMNAHVIYFKDGKPHSEPGFEPLVFPDQAIPMEDLMKDDVAVNPLMKECDNKMIRYFHLPDNNMYWVEEVIARHYREQRPEYDGLFRRPPESSTKSYMLLRPEFWRGQQHGGRNDAVHARHMRPRCDVISTNPQKMEEVPNNLVLFLPYLHWETDRRRARYAEVIRVATEAHKSKTNPLTGERPRASTLSVGDGPFYKPTSETITKVVSLTQNETSESSTMGVVQDCPIHEVSLPITRPQKLGMFLLNAARLAEAMALHEHEQMIKDHLHGSPPLHPRRTLDQAYYWTLKSTEKRDRDQVVYRATTPVKKFVHHHFCGEKNEDKWTPQHCIKKSRCEQCKRDIRLLPRVVMVDQLWLWILNGNTIITAFPRRWGRNKPDPSGVHRSIRTRLKAHREGEIRSAYDLALIIVDQCTKVFFDRTKTTDRQPQVMDIFANAIGNLSSKQTNAYNHFWNYTEQASAVYRNKDAIESADMHKVLLNINPEGKLVREINDILDELQIMKHIMEHQKRVLKEYTLHVARTIVPNVDNGHQNLTVDAPKDQNRAYIAQGINKMANNPEAKSGAEWTLTCAQDLLSSFDDRVSELDNLSSSAKHTQQALGNLLALKQQQAGVVQARMAVKQGEETLKQGRSIMLFTVFTIIFLPLSFCSSIFGMNVSDYKDGLLTLRGQLKVMIPTSFAVVIVACLLAFSSSIRAALAYMVEVSWTMFITKPPPPFRIYDLWEGYRRNWKPLLERKNEKVRRLKDMARKQRQKRKEERTGTHSVSNGNRQDANFDDSVVQSNGGLDMGVVDEETTKRPEVRSKIGMLVRKIFNFLR